MTDNELDRQLRDSMSALDLPEAPSTLRSAVVTFDRVPVELPRPRARLGLIAVPILGIALIAMAMTWWSPRAGLTPGGSASPTGAPTATQGVVRVASCGRLEAPLCDRVAAMVVDYADLRAGTSLVLDHVCPPGARCQATIEVLAVVIGPSGQATATYGVEGRFEPESVYDRPFEIGLPEHIVRLVAATNGSSPAPVPSATPSPLAYADDCAAFDLSIRRCEYIVGWAKGEAGFMDRDPVVVRLLGDPDCPDRTAGCPTRTTSFVVRVRLVNADGSFRDESVFCGIGGRHTLLCTETPVIDQRTPMTAYHDIPCSGEAPDNPCATPVPTPDPSALAAAEPLEVGSLIIPIDHIGTYIVDVGRAVVPNGILSEATFSLGDDTPDEFLVTPDGIQLTIHSLEGGGPFENIYAHGWRSGTERVEATLSFTIESFEPGAVLEVRDVIVR